MSITSDVSITDLINSIGVLLGVPTAIWGIFKLFKRDKEKEAQIAALNDIAISQNAMIGKMSEQIEELSKQTQQFEYHSILYKETNDLMREQLALQNKIFVTDLEFKNKSEELRSKERKLTIRPFFKVQGGSSFSGTVTIHMVNFGNQAKIIEIRETGFAHISRVSPIPNTFLDNQAKYDFVARYKEDKFNLDYSGELVYSDQDGNQYKQKFSGRGSVAKLEQPEEIT